MAYLTLFFAENFWKIHGKNPKVRGGGGQAGWAKFPTFTENLFCKLPLCWNTSLILYELGPQRSTDEIYNRMIWIQSWKLLVSYFGRYCHPIKQSEDCLEWRDSTRDSLLKRMQKYQVEQTRQQQKSATCCAGKARGVAVKMSAAQLLPLPAF